jgi:DNA-binding MarR family transcriptional regulator
MPALVPASKEAAKAPSLADQVREQFAALIQLMAVANPQPWMGLDITMPQFKVMLFLWHTGRARVGVLAEKLGIHLSNVTGILDRLVEAGFVCREEDAGDRRLVVSRLTPKGEAILAQLYDSRAAHVAERLERIPAEELVVLKRGLQALLAQW